MYFSLIISFLLLLGIIVVMIQNDMALDLKFFTWKLQLSLAALVLYSAVIGAAIVAILSLPKLGSKYLKIRRLRKQLNELEKKSLELEQYREKSTP